MRVADFPALRTVSFHRRERPKADVDARRSERLFPDRMLLSSPLSDSKMVAASPCPYIGPISTLLLWRWSACALSEIQSDS